MQAAPASRMLDGLRPTSAEPTGENCREQLCPKGGRGCVPGIKLRRGLDLWLGRLSPLRANGELSREYLAVVDPSTDGLAVVLVFGSIDLHH